jgi:CcmD family protein
VVKDRGAGEYPMSGWGFVFLAYGIVSTALVVYLYLLKRRLAKADSELAKLRSLSLEESEQNAKR